MPGQGSVVGRERLKGRRVARLVESHLTEARHDELLLEVPDAETSAVRELVRAELCGAYPLDPPLAVDVGIGDNWAEAKT